VAKSGSHGPDSSEWLQVVGAVQQVVNATSRKPVRRAENFAQDRCGNAESGAKYSLTARIPVKLSTVRRLGALACKKLLLCQLRRDELNTRITVLGQNFQLVSGSGRESAIFTSGREVQRDSVGMELISFPFSLNSVCVTDLIPVRHVRLH
jgi:hypothetical protein